MSSNNGSWIVEVNRHGHNGHSEGWTFCRFAASAEQANSRAEGMRKAHANARWLPGRAPSRPYTYRVRFDQVEPEHIGAFAFQH